MFVGLVLLQPMGQMCSIDIDLFYKLHHEIDLGASILNKRDTSCDAQAE